MSQSATASVTDAIPVRRHAQVQSPLHPVARKLRGSRLFWSMTARVLTIWLIVMGLPIYAGVGGNGPPL